MRIVHFPLQAHCYAFGGFEIQMLATYAAVKLYSKGSDVEVDLIDYWSKKADFDIAHFWGLDLANYNNIYWSKKSGKIVVMTALLGYAESRFTKIKNNISKYIGLRKLINKMLQQIDALIVVNEIQKDKAISCYGVHPSKVFTIPNIVSDKFFNYKKEILIKPYDNYVISTGNICPRKNQLNLIKACIKNNTNLVLIGKLLDGEYEYGKLIEETLNGKENITWIRGLEENSDELINLIANSSSFVLVSNEENQPISLLEAAVCQKPLIISNKDFANQVYYKNSCKVNPQSVDEIINALNKVLITPNDYIVPASILNDCEEKSVAKKYMEIYKQLVNND